MVTPSRPAERSLFDRMIYSAGNYWVGLFTDLAAALAFLALGVHRFSGRALAAAGIILIGFVLCGLLEYIVHRWILHGPPSMARRGHAQHHAEPRAFISTPLFGILVGMLITWRLLGFVFPAGTTALLVAGLYARYNYFALLHHRQHHRGTGVSYVGLWGRLERFHDIHHHRPGVNFGISTTLWDRLFRTFEPAHGPVANDSRRNTIASYSTKLSRKPSAAN